ncbi:glycosyltransferase family 39 protein [Achromobacter insolitus]|uniref:ArnT family glycosyltransferase n=1 Tax=Achromobacter insolitus TaxID=217204 RepID=UPI002658E3A4|nr:glycosyltransferase family 39 protein [Achromobacter insolitus]WKK17091.1 glycosyltransferase family 39 protein [Achromobacter insolitus]
MFATTFGRRSDWTPPAGRFLLAIGAWLTFLAWIRPLTLPDEGRYAGVAWDMLRSGSHAVPLLDGMPYFHKPPLFYWLTELSFSIFGVHPWAARAPSWLAAWAAAAALYCFLRRHRDAATAALTALILATTPFFYGGAQFANLDMLVAGLITLCVLAAADAALRFERGEAWRGMSLAAGALAPLALLLAEVIQGARRADADSATRLVRLSVAVGAGICVIAVGVAAHNARGSAGPLAKVVREQARPDDTFVSLHTYPFDLALYARAVRPAWVVDDWHNPEVPVRDNWRKELYDAAQFDPATGGQVLLNPAEFNARLCTAEEGARYWVWGTAADNPVYLPLQGLAPVASSVKYVMWRVDVDAALRQRVCGGTPKTG